MARLNAIGGAPAGWLTVPGLLGFARHHPALAAVAFIGLAGVAATVAAWTFELAVGLVPCSLCLKQRIPYYLAMPVAAVTIRPQAGCLTR
jgi:disulfide bond formation protein DsbB